jgi:repressor LexA
MKGVTKRQNQILSFISNYIDKNGYSPSYREIQEHFEISSSASVHKHVQALQRKGILDKEKNCSRSIKLEKEKPHDNEILLPYIGYISASQPIEPFNEQQFITVPSFLVPNPKKTYAIQVQGQFLKEELIVDGDLLLIEIRPDIDDGELVLALVRPNDMCVKKYYAQENHIVLKGQHTRCKDLVLSNDDFKVQGIIVAMMRLY